MKRFWQRLGMGVVVRDGDDAFSAPDLARVLGGVPDDDPTWRAVRQVIVEEMREAQMAAEATVANHGLCASEVGGVQHLRRLRERLEALRVEGRKLG